MTKKILVCQVGARHRYLTPRLMYKAGILSYLYTDSFRYSFLGNMARVIRSLGIKNKSVNRLVNRNPLLPKEVVKASDSLFF